MRARALLVVATILVAACGSQSERVNASAGGQAVWPLRGTAAPNADSIQTRPIIVKVPADPAARPQSGFAAADLILEIPVEGGLTRWAVVFQSKDPGKVGPVRSARQSDLNYLPLLHAAVAHVGASEQVTKLVRDAAAQANFVDIDEFQHPDAFERTSDRQAPYNAFANGAKLRELAGSQHVTVAGLKFGDAPASGKDAPSLTVSYADGVTYTYDPSRGAYHRAYTSGAKTTDGGTEVMPENVVIVSTDVKEIRGHGRRRGRAFRRLPRYRHRSGRRPPRREAVRRHLVP